MTESAPLDWPTLTMALGFCALITVLLVVVIWQSAATWRARAALAREVEYRKFAERATSALETTTGELARLRDRLERVEVLLSQFD